MPSFKEAIKKHKSRIETDARNDKDSSPGVRRRDRRPYEEPTAAARAVGEGKQIKGASAASNGGRDTLDLHGPADSVEVKTSESSDKKQIVAKREGGDGREEEVLPSAFDIARPTSAPNKIDPVIYSASGMAKDRTQIRGVALSESGSGFVQLADQLGYEMAGRVMVLIDVQRKLGAVCLSQSDLCTVLGLELQSLRRTLKLLLEKNILEVITQHNATSHNSTVYKVRKIEICFASA